MAHKVKSFNSVEQQEYDRIMDILLNTQSGEEMEKAGNNLQELYDQWYMRTKGVPRGVNWKRN